ncbi:hypothetical protein [Succinatimonas hippei]|uniref:hypothetical protein n=1 Tax=Succinatimonas hippei TaxID=626938 RepID=UPI0024930A44|nr:hypothetical protein [Succinatimonas hippei]
MSERSKTHKTVLEKKMAIFIKELLKRKGIKGKTLKAKSGYGLGALYDFHKHISSRMFKTYVETIVELSGTLTDEEHDKANNLLARKQQKERELLNKKIQSLKNLD